MKNGLTFSARIDRELVHFELLVKIHDTVFKRFSYKEQLFLEKLNTSLKDLLNVIDVNELKACFSFRLLSPFQKTVIKSIEIIVLSELYTSGELTEVVPVHLLQLMPLYGTRIPH